MAATDAAAARAMAAGRKRRQGRGRRRRGGGARRPERTSDEAAPDPQVGRRADEARREPGPRARQQLPVYPLPGCGLRRSPEASQVREGRRRTETSAFPQTSCYIFLTLRYLTALSFPRLFPRELRPIRLKVSRLHTRSCRFSFTHYMAWRMHVTARCNVESLVCFPLGGLGKWSPVSQP